MAFKFCLDRSQSKDKIFSTYGGYSPLRSISYKNTLKTGIRKITSTKRFRSKITMLTVFCCQLLEVGISIRTLLLQVFQTETCHN
jgi:hypothetical protein